MGIFETLDQFGLNYVVDPTSAYADNVGQTSIDFLQFPYQTLMYRGGDCDDLSILVSSLFEAIGIKTAFITIPGHIYMAFDTGLTPEQAHLQFSDFGDLIIRDGKVWMPLEITLTDEGFNKAWRVGAREWNTAVAKNVANFYPMADSWKLYKPVSVPGASAHFTMPDRKIVAKLFQHRLDEWVEREIGPLVTEYEKELARRDKPETRNSLGVLYGEYGLFTEAEDQFKKARRTGYIPAILNTANVFFAKQKYEKAIEWYNLVLAQEPRNDIALLGIARCQYELGKYNECDAAYTKLCDVNIELAGEYTYLGSFENTKGRSYSLADRLATMAWCDPSNISEKLKKETADELTTGIAGDKKQPAAEQVKTLAQLESEAAADSVAPPAPSAITTDEETNEAALEASENEENETELAAANKALAAATPATIKSSSAEAVVELPGLSAQIALFTPDAPLVSEADNAPAASGTAVEQETQPAASTIAVKQEIQPSATETAVEQESQPSASETAVEQETQPAANTTAVEQVTQPSATETAVEQATQPSATETSVEQEAQIAATETAVEQVTQPSATETSVEPVTQPSATETSVEQETQIAATETAVEQVTQPSATETSVEQETQIAATETAVEQVTQPSATETSVEQETQIAASETAVEPETQPAANTTAVEQETQPSANETAVEQETTPAATETAVEPVTQPAATETAVEPVAAPAATETAVEPEAQPAVNTTSVEQVTQPSATETAVEQESQPSASETAVEPETQPAANTTAVEPEAQPAANTTAVEQETQPSATETAVEQATQIAANETAVEQETQPSATETAVEQETQPAANTTSVEPAATPTTSTTPTATAPAKEEPVVNRAVPRFTEQPSAEWAPDVAYKIDTIPGMKTYEEEMGDYQNEKAFLYEDDDDSEKTESTDEKKTAVAEEIKPEVDPFDSYLDPVAIKQVKEKQIALAEKKTVQSTAKKTAIPAAPVTEVAVTTAVTDTKADDGKIIEQKSAVSEQQTAANVTENEAVKDEAVKDKTVKNENGKDGNKTTLIAIIAAALAALGGAGVAIHHSKKVHEKKEV